MPVTDGNESRSRIIPYDGGAPGRLVLHQYNHPNPDLETVLDGEARFGDWQGLQVTAGETHHRWRKHMSASGEDVGGDFHSYKRWAEPEPYRIGVRYEPRTGTGYISYSGVCLAVGPGGYPFPPDPSSASLTAWGAEAVSKAAPTTSFANTAMALAELVRDGSPHLLGHSLWAEKTNLAKAAGDDYLNYQFGFVPLANDIAKFANAVVSFNSALKQLKRDAGRVVRRKYQFPPQESSEATLIDHRYPFVDPWSGYLANLSAPASELWRTRTISVRRWFSGAFQYWLPHDSLAEDTLLGHAVQAQKMLGLEITPEVLWNLAPWSWALDWFSNAGSVVSNISRFLTDSLVMRYGYVMEHSICSDTYSLNGPNPFRIDDETSGSVVTPQPVTFSTQVKKRQRANPFGFGLTYDGLSEVQKAILIALGISRS